MSETAWIIEKTNPQYPDCTLGVFLGFSGVTSGRRPGVLVWHNSVLWAMRFARKEDAENFIGIMEVINDGVPLRDSMPGLRSCDPRALVVEHSWGMEP